MFTLTLSLISILCQISRVRHLFSKAVLTTILNCLVFLETFLLLNSLVWNVCAPHKQTATCIKLRRPCVSRLTPRSLITSHQCCAHCVGLLLRISYQCVMLRCYTKQLMALHHHIQSVTSTRDQLSIYSYNTRSRDNLVIPFCTTATAQKSFSYRAITAWNSLIIEKTKNTATVSVLKRAVKPEIYNSPQQFLGLELQKRLIIYLNQVFFIIILLQLLQVVLFDFQLLYIKSEEPLAGDFINLLLLAAEHFIDGNKKCICWFGFESQSPHVIERSSKL